MTTVQKTQSAAKAAPKAAPKAAAKAAKAAPQAAKAAPQAAAKAAAKAAPKAPAIITAIVAWVDALPSSVTFYRNGVNHHRKQGTVFPRLPLLAEDELKKVFEVTQSRISKNVNANGFTESKRVFDAYIVGKYGVGAIPTK